MHRAFVWRGQTVERVPLRGNSFKPRSLDDDQNDVRVLRTAVDKSHG